MILVVVVASKGIRALRIGDDSAMLRISTCSCSYYYCCCCRPITTSGHITMMLVHVH